MPEAWHVEHLKLVGYLLNIDHPYGLSTARVFLGYGFTPDDPGQLASALFDHAASLPCRVVETGHGHRFIFEGPLQAPNGMISRLRSVWIADSDDLNARLLTAYPYDERRP